MSFLAEYFAEHQHDWDGDEADEKTIRKGSAVKEQRDYQPIAEKHPCCQSQTRFIHDYPPLSLV